MIKVTFDSFEKGLERPEKTTINIFGGKMFVRYDVKGKAESTVQQMRKDGRKNVLYSRGCMIQLFPKKTEKEILAIAKMDIKNGVIVAKSKTKKDIQIKNLVIEEVEEK